MVDAEHGIGSGNQQGVGRLGGTDRLAGDDRGVRSQQRLNRRLQPDTLQRKLSLVPVEQAAPRQLVAAQNEGERHNSGQAGAGKEARDPVVAIAEGYRSSSTASSGSWFGTRVIRTFLIRRPSMSTTSR